jgi:hypothetical protein
MSESRNVSNLMIGDCDGCPQGTSIGVLTLHHFVQVIVFGLWRHVPATHVRGT